MWSRLIERSITTSAPDESSVESFQQLVGETVFDDDTLLEVITTRAVEHKDAIAAVRAPVLGEDCTRVSNPRGQCDPYERGKSSA